VKLLVFLGFVTLFVTIRRRASRRVRTENMMKQEEVAEKGALG
jgi:hypothetical protein